MGNYSKIMVNYDKIVMKLWNFWRLVWVWTSARYYPPLVSVVSCRIILRFLSTLFRMDDHVICHYRVTWSTLVPISGHVIYAVPNRRSRDLPCSQLTVAVGDCRLPDCSNVQNFRINFFWTDQFFTSSETHTIFINGMHGDHRSLRSVFDGDSCSMEIILGVLNVLNVCLSVLTVSFERTSSRWQILTYY